MKKVRPIRTSKKVKELLEGFKSCGALGAGSVGRAYELVKKMFDKNYFVILAFTGHLVASGLRNIITRLVEQDKVGAVITSGAGIVHDTLFSLGEEHYQGGFGSDDSELRSDGFGRAGNVLVPVRGFAKFEDFCHQLFDKVEEPISVRELIQLMGEDLEDESSFLKKCAEKGVPVYAPGFQDSMLGLQAALYKQTNELVIDACKDMLHLNALLEEQDKVGAIIIGGGLPKHYALASNILRGGVDAAVNITTSTPFDGSLSGARLEEARSWGKASSSGELVTVVGDATVLFPLIISGLE